MFDAKSLLETVFGGARSGPGEQGVQGLDELLGGSPRSTAPGGGKPASGQAGGLEDMLRNLTGDGAAGGGSNVSDILGKLQAGGGDVANTLRDILGQAVEGTKEGAGKIGAVAGLEDLVKQMSGGRSSEELMTQLKALIANNQLAAGTVLGGLGALVLGTGTGRSLAVGAAKLGALALIGGLAYKAYQNYTKGASPEAAPAQSLAEAPVGSGFEPSAISNDSAALYLRAMIAAAAADGRVDDAERGKVLSGLGQAGVEADAARFLERELTNPATIDDLAAAARSKEDAARVYTAARIVIEPDTEGERAFLAVLAKRLGIDDALAAHIDATTRGAAA